MTDLSPPIAFEDVLLEGTRRMSRGARMNPELYHALKGEIQSLDNTAACMTLPEGTSPTTVRNWILHVAAVLGIPATVGKTPAGLLFWRSSEEDQQKAQEAAGRLQRSQHKGKAAPQKPARFTATNAGRSLRYGANHTFDEPIHA